MTNTLTIYDKYGNTLIETRFDSCEEYFSLTAVEALKSIKDKATRWIFPIARNLANESATWGFALNELGAIGLIPLVLSWDKDTQAEVDKEGYLNLSSNASIGSLDIWFECEGVNYNPSFSTADYVDTWLYELYCVALKFKRNH